MIGAALRRWVSQPPAGHRPGHTLACALADLRGVFTPFAVEPSRAVLGMGAGGASIEVHECVERHFQMHIVSLEMGLAVAAQVEPGIRIDLRNSGMLRRTGIACHSHSRHRMAVAGLSGRLETDSQLCHALTTLDFRRCWLESTTAGWVARIEPYGASEVVNRMPSFRRYIRMDDRQVFALKEAFTALQRLLADTVPASAPAVQEVSR